MRHLVTRSTFRSIIDDVYFSARNHSIILTTGLTHLLSFSLVWPVNQLRNVTKGYQPIEAFGCKHKWRAKKRRLESVPASGKDGLLYYIGMMNVLSCY